MGKDNMLLSTWFCTSYNASINMVFVLVVLTLHNVTKHATNSWVQKLAYFSSQVTQNCCWNEILLRKTIRDIALEGPIDLYFYILCIYDFCIYLFIFPRKIQHQSHSLRPCTKMWKPRRVRINKSHVYLSKLFKACIGDTGFRFIKTILIYHKTLML